MAETAQSVFNERIPKALADNPDKFTGIDEVFKFEITGDGGGTWRLDMKAQPPTCTEGDGEATCTIQIAWDDFVALMGNLMLAMQFMSQNKMKIDNPAAAMKLQRIMPLIKQYQS